jgi:hypothetical protein
MDSYCGHCGQFMYRQDADVYVPWDNEPHNPVFICAECSARCEDAFLWWYLHEGLPAGSNDRHPSQAERRARARVRAHWRLHPSSPVFPAVRPRLLSCGSVAQDVDAHRHGLKP